MLTSGLLSPSLLGLFFALRFLKPFRTKVKLAKGQAHRRMRLFLKQAYRNASMHVSYMLSFLPN